MKDLFRDKLRGFGLATSFIVLASCASTGAMSDTAKTGFLCETESVAISTGFVGAGQHGCALSVGGAVLTVWPEASTAGPINPSPWYAFRAELRSSKPVTIRLDYAGYWHRYHPWTSHDGGETWQRLPDSSVYVEEQDHLASITLPGGAGPLLVAARPLITPSDMDTWSQSLAEHYDMETVTYGESLDGRPLKALLAGSQDAERIVIALTGQHPPEQSGVAAFKVFAETLMEEIPANVLANTRIVLLPMTNPDGRARGHWRHNNGGLDLNRDWLNQTQPAVADTVAFFTGEAEGRDPIAFMDFHSTHETLVYTQPFWDNYADMTFPHALKRAFDSGIDPDPEWISGHNASAGTSKNWALQTLDVAGLTIELADDAPADEIEQVGQLTAFTLINLLAKSSREPSEK